MEGTNKKILFIAIVLALITSTLIFTYLRKIENTYKNIEYVNIVVAAKTIEPRTVITNQDLMEVKIDKNLINKNALQKKEEILNRTVKERIYEGEQILKTRLAAGENELLSYQIPKDKRAVTIFVDEASAVGYFISPGDYVDVIAVLKGTQDQTMHAISKTILQNVLVLGIGQEKDVIDKVQGKTEKKNLKNATANEIDTIKTVTLAVGPDEAEKIALCEHEGTLKLTLRSVGDKNTFYSGGTTINNLIQ